MNEIQKANKALVDKYPWLLPRGYDDKVPEDYDYSYTELDAMPEGWRIAFGPLMCEDIQKELEKFYYADDFRIAQIKEKFGELRFYHNGVPVGSRVSDIIDDYAALSGYICISCGALDVPSTDGWIVPVCKECICKMGYWTNNKDGAREYWEGLSKAQAPHMLPTKRGYIRFSKDKGTEKIEVDMSETEKKVRDHARKRGIPMAQVRQ